MSWKVTLKNGEIITNPDFYQVYHHPSYWSFRKVIIMKNKITTGHLWWKKEIIESNEKLETVLVIPIDNILKIEQLNDLH